MRIILSTPNNKILLKNCKSYLELDKIISAFSSKNEIIAKLDLDEDAELIVLDNDGKQIVCDCDLIRKTISFYEQDKGNEFIDWIYEGSQGDEYGANNRGRLHEYFLNSMNDLANENNKLNTKIAEGRRLHGLCLNIVKELGFFDGTPATLKQFRDYIVPSMNEYVKRNSKYDYAYMRKFVTSLVCFFGYKLEEPKIDVKTTTFEEQEKILKEFKTRIHNHLYDQKQVTISDLENQKEEVVPIYDENGIKIDEKEFLEEFIAKKLHL